ncbi:MAG TPA: GTPase [Planctomycetota bacterium]
MFAVLLTSPGRGALAVIHVAGAGARARVEALCAAPIDDTLRVRRMEDVDEIMARTTSDGFTAEETVEITAHGGTAVVERVFAALDVERITVDELLDRGVSTGKLDQIRAEAWSLLPAAKTERAALMLQAQAEGALSKAVAALRGPGDATRLLETAAAGQALATPRRVVLAGAPNVGKSSLFNALVERDRAIVSPIAGTTRDPVRETIAIDGVPLELVDTAGVEEPRDPLEALSIERTRKALSAADVVLFLFDAEAGARGPELTFLEQLGHRRLVPLVNKVDVGTKKPLLEALPVSAKTGQGLDDLRRKLLRMLDVGRLPEAGAAVVFTPRQERLLRDLLAGRLALDAAKAALTSGPRS